MIENFERLIAPFAETLGYFPVDRLSVITGAEGSHEPISAIHPNAIESGEKPAHRRRDGGSDEQCDENARGRKRTDEPGVDCSVIKSGTYKPISLGPPHIVCHFYLRLYALSDGWVFLTHPLFFHCVLFFMIYLFTLCISN